jgi:hypothetical protein
MYRVTLRVVGLDMESDATIEKLSEELSDISWMRRDGLTLATLRVDGENPVASASEIARRITYILPGVEIDGVDEDLVGISDIAGRIGVSRETVRLWTAGERGPGNFPAPRGSLGGSSRGSIRVWDWPSVNAWLAEHYELGDEELYLSSKQVAELNAAVLRVDSPMDSEWHDLTSAPIVSAHLELNAISEVSAWNSRASRRFRNLIRQALERHSLPPSVIVHVASGFPVQMPDEFSSEGKASWR